MYLVLGDELIHILCDDQQAEQALGLLFHGWLSPTKPELPVDSDDRPTRPLPLVLQKLDKPELPDNLRPIFSDPVSLTTVFEGERNLYIRFGPDAAARLPFKPGGVDGPVTIQVTPNVLSAARLEDIIYSSLAPVLRRRGLFMIHAFAVEKGGNVILLVGQSGSGKTTTGLSLIGYGWRYLANDVVILCEQAGTVHALPTPGGIGLDARSIALLSSSRRFPSDAPRPGLKHYYAATDFIELWGHSAPVSRLLFPVIEPEDAMSLQPVPRSVTLARLMEASVDRWDTTSLNEHLHILGLLSQQATGFDLLLNPNLEQLPSVLGSAL